MSVDITCLVEQRKDGRWQRPPRAGRESDEFDFGVGGIGGNCHELFRVLGYPVHLPIVPSTKHLQTIAPIAEGRGMPGDCSEAIARVAKEEREFAKSHGWVLLGELKKHLETHRDSLAPWLVELLEKSIVRLESYGGDSDVRLIYWFHQ